MTGGCYYASPGLSNLSFVKQENLAEINIHWLAHPNVFAHLIFTAVLFYIITKVNILAAFNFHGFASSAEIAKTNHRWHFLVLQ